MSSWALALFALVAVPAVADCPAFDQRHAKWDEVLKAHVRSGVVDYAVLHDKPALLDGYLSELTAVCKKDYDGWSREQQVALWVNAYNAFNVHLILEHYPLKSIRQIGVLPGAAWREKFIAMGQLVGVDAKLSLNDIEHEILRKKFPDARLHFALVCASKSCPELRGEAYRAERLGEQFDDAGRRFLADATKNQLSGATWKVSSIFKWYREDFERDGPGLVPFLRRLSGAPKDGVTPELEFLDYDWSLNGK